LAAIMENIKFTFQNESKIIIYGTYKNTKQISQMVGEYLSKLDDEIVEKVFEVTDIEANIIEKNMTKFNQEI
jgi:GTP-sensing pleiotropic transcriptional regulator CodY